MSDIEDQDLAALQILSSDLVAALQSVTDDRWALATPCSDWDLRALVDHVVGGNWFTLWILRGFGAGDAMTRTIKQFNGDAATTEQAVLSVDDLLAAFTQPAVLDQTWDHVVGVLSGRQILRLRLHDLIVHAWDIGQALDSAAILPESLVRWGLEELSSDDSTVAKHFELAANPSPEPISHPETLGSATSIYLRRFGR